MITITQRVKATASTAVEARDATNVVNSILLLHIHIRFCIKKLDQNCTPTSYSLCLCLYIRIDSALHNNYGLGSTDQLITAVAANSMEFAIDYEFVSAS